MTNLEGASIIVVGATGGLGRHIARMLHERGAKLTLSARSMTNLEALGIPATFVPGDLADPNFARTLVATAVTANGRLDGVINAAGVVAFGPVAELSNDTLEQLWQVNAAGPVRVMRAAADSLAQSAANGNEPFVVTLSGLVAETPTNGLAAYSAVKTALYAFTQVAGRELRRQKIRVLDARPGHTETDLSRHPIAGQTPKFPTGYLPEAVAERIVAAIINGEKDLPSTAFTDIPAAPTETIPAPEHPVDADMHPAARMAAEMSLEVATPLSAQSAASAHSASSVHSASSTHSPASAHGEPPAPDSST